MRNAERRNGQLDALGQYNFEVGRLDVKPAFGYHDVYDDLEMGVRSKVPRHRWGKR